MNIFATVTPIIGAVNASTPATLQKSEGYQTMADGTQAPIYAEAQDITAQVQSLTSGDLRQVEGLNLNGTLRAIYLYGHAKATVRVSQKGGDLVTIASESSAGVWLVHQVLESWDGWCKVACSLQNGA